ncbi:GNAT family N-acetyltransferase [Aurantimonas sp. A2-1-M11]|uniref:GNAT family N-acetyltransferase n=1 Tax=Aurantimonas sp. A2-1-M11 TaxID=3113712 RepID=UPI002F93064B
MFGALPPVTPVVPLFEGSPPVLPEIDLAVPQARMSRHLSIYAPNAVFELVGELAHLSRRAIEPNVFFDPQFLAPAMPRLDDRKVRLMVVRDEKGTRSRLRLLMPFSVERSAFIGGVSTIRAWTHPFGPLGTLPVDGDDPDETLASFLSTLTRPELGLPDMLVVPDVRIDGPMATTLLAVAGKGGLPTTVVNTTSRAALVKTGDGAIPTSLSGRRRRELARQARHLAETGRVSLRTAQSPDDVRLALEDFFSLEASGWKGRQRTALIIDRYRSAFAREAINALAQDGRVRIYTLHAGSRPVASLVVLVDRGEAYAWKTAYDETFAAVSPGQQLVAAATSAMLGDPAVERADSCTVPDHFVMNRFWPDRIAVGTLVIGLTSDSGNRVEKVARGLASMRRSRNLVRLTRQRLQGMLAVR